MSIAESRAEVTSPFTRVACDESPTTFVKRPKSHDQLSIFRSREVGYGYVAQVGRVPPAGLFSRRAALESRALLEGILMATATASERSGAAPAR